MFWRRRPSEPDRPDGDAAGPNAGPAAEPRRSIPGARPSSSRRRGAPARRGPPALGRRPVRPARSRRAMMPCHAGTRRRPRAGAARDGDGSRRASSAAAAASWPRLKGLLGRGDPDARDVGGGRGDPDRGRRGRDARRWRSSSGRAGVTTRAARWRPSGPSSRRCSSTATPAGCRTAVEPGARPRSSWSSGSTGPARPPRSGSSPRRYRAEGQTVLLAAGRHVPGGRHRAAADLGRPSRRAGRGPRAGRRSRRPSSTTPSTRRSPATSTC